jgi:hypothetical protein
MRPTIEEEIGKKYSAHLRGLNAIDTEIANLLSSNGNPPALPGDSQSLTVPGVPLLWI